MDVTEWLAWFLDTLHRAVDQAQATLDAVLVKTRFWWRWASTPLTERQVKLLNRPLDGHGISRGEHHPVHPLCQQTRTAMAGACAADAFTHMHISRDCRHRGPTKPHECFAWDCSR
jgi:hypothetical protein